DRRLEAVLAQDAHRLAAVHVRQPDIHDHQIDLAGLGLLDALGAGIDRDRLEFVMQRKLLDERVPQLVVVVHDQDFTAIRHLIRPFRALPGAFARGRAFGDKRASYLELWIKNPGAMGNSPISTFFVRRKPGFSTRGWLIAGPLALPVALGRGGIKANKRE